LPEQFIEIPRSAFASLISHLSGAFPSDDDFGPYGPRERREIELVAALRALRHGPRPNWEPTPSVRVPAEALALLARLAGPSPVPWAQTELNPQPLPPRMAAALGFAHEVANKVIAVHEAAKRLPEQERTREMRFAAHQLSRFVSDVGDERCPVAVWVKWPIPQPGPHRHDLTEGIAPAELIAMGAQFVASASTAPDHALRESLGDAGQQLMSLGLGRLQAGTPSAEMVEF
jgi:hypothetical protein